jgi:hypothetical protein
LSLAGAAVRKALRKVVKDRPSRERLAFHSLADPAAKAAYAQLQKDAASPQGKAKKANAAKKARGPKKS